MKYNAINNNNDVGEKYMKKIDNFYSMSSMNYILAYKW